MLYCLVAKVNAPELYAFEQMHSSNRTRQDKITDGKGQFDCYGSGVVVHGRGTFHFAGAVYSPPTADAQVTEHRLTILHTNDLRGGIYSEHGFDDADQAGNQVPENEVDRGGLAALVSMIRAHDRVGGDSILVLDGGNAMGATPACDVDGCRTLFQLMDMAEYDAMAVGGHEFTYGLDTLVSRAGQANFRVLGANLGLGDTVHETIAPFLLTERSGLRIAVMGLVSSRMADDLSSVDPAGLEIHDPRETLESLLNGPAGLADVRIALVNMKIGRAEGPRAGFPQVQLFIAEGTTDVRTAPVGARVRFVDVDTWFTHATGHPSDRLQNHFPSRPKTAISKLSPSGTCGSSCFHLANRAFVRSSGP